MTYVEPRQREWAAPSSATLMPVLLLAAIALATTVAWWALTCEYISVGALPLLVLAGLATTTLAAATGPRHHRKQLAWLVAVAFCVHVASAIAVFGWVVQQLGEPVLFPDEGTYDLYSWMIAASIQAGHVPVFNAGAPGYFAVVAGTYLTLGHDIFWPRIANLAVSAYLLVPVFGLANGLFGQVVARRSALLVGFAPAFLAFPAFMIKDLYVALLVALVAWNWVDLKQGSPPIRTLLVIACASVTLYFFRPETAILMLLLGVAWFAISGQHASRLGRPLTSFYILGIAFALMLLLGTGGMQIVDRLGLGALDTHVATGQQVVVERSSDNSLISSFVLGGSLEERLRALPAFVLQPLIQPIPIFNNELATVLAPGVLFLYGSFPFVIFALVRCLRREAVRSMMLWGPIALLLLATYASLYISFRYRIQYEPLLMVLAALGITNRSQMPSWTIPVVALVFGALVSGYLIVKVI